MPIVGVLFLYVLLSMFARLLDADITTRERFGGKVRSGQAAFDVVAGVGMTLIISYLVSITLIQIYPFFATTIGVYLTVLFSFVVSGIWMIWGDIKRDGEAKNGRVR